MKSLLSILSEVMKECEHFCFNFTKGFSQNIQLLRQLIENQEEQPLPRSPTQEPAQTELARRRAQLKKKQGVEEQMPRVEEGTSVRGYLCKLVLWNFLYCMLIILGMNQLLLPALNWLFRDLLSRNEGLLTAVTMTVTLSWKTPILCLVKVSNIFWLNDLSTLAYRKTMGKPVTTGFTFLVSDFVYTIIFQACFFIQVILCAWIPVRVRHINIFELVLTAIMYSMYAFEYKWMNMGYGAQTRMDLIEKNFGFHFGFGFPISFIVLYFDDFWIGIILSSFFFPAMVLSAINASEPREARGRSSYVFYPTDKVLVALFWVGRRLGVAKTGKYMVALAAVGLLLWLGASAALARLLGLLWNCIPTDVIWNLWGGSGEGGGDDIDAVTS